MISFNYPSDLRLNSDTHQQMKYDKKISFLKNLHLGQLKLFSNELEFILSYCCDENLGKRKKLILYIGAGPGNHLVYLAKMFPTFEWHLFDCRFDKKLEDVKNIFLEKRYFDDESLKVYQEMMKREGNNLDLYLISDIRDLSYNSKDWNVEEELKVLDDMALQKSWVLSLEPKYSMLKFRLPFPEPEVISRLGETVPYLHGTIYKQPWARGKSIETRLIVPGNDLRDIEYSLSDYEGQMFYHNAVLRQKDYIFPLSDVLNGKKISKYLTINTRYDCAYIITLLYQYFKRSNPNIDSEKLEKNIVKILNVISDYEA
jgi:hypothetical protein